MGGSDDASGEDELAEEERSDSFDELLAAAVRPADDLPSASGALHGTAPLVSGSLIGGRFVVEDLAGAGGMGAVYRCRDAVTGEAVAVKIIRRAGDPNAGRFKREIAVLSELSHEAIVRYVAHGSTGAGMPYMVMEWLDGEDLGQRLGRKPLSIDECVALGRRLCGGLAAAHARGFVHRDLKPSNVFLVGGLAEAAKLLDFGLAHRDATTQTVTRAGTLLGTVGYMAPEQVRGEGGPDARTDLFSLGCVLFECLTGRPAFAGPHCLAVLEQVLREEVPSVAALRPEVGTRLDQLVRRLLSKDREGRPAGAAAVERELTLRAAPSSAPPRTDVPRLDPLLGPPQVLAAVVLARATTPHEPALSGAVAPLAGRFDARLFHVSSGSLALVLAASAERTLRDRAAQAVRCALELKVAAPAFAVSVGAGLVDLSSGAPVGPAIERALTAEGAAAPCAERVLVDGLTAGLLEVPRGRERVAEGRGVLALVAERGVAQLRRDLHVHCSGRDKELALLEATLDECISDQVARVVLVTAGSGMGKSCLADAFAERARRWTDVQLLTVRAEPRGTHAKLGVAGELVRCLDVPTSPGGSALSDEALERLQANTAADALTREHRVQQRVRLRQALVSCLDQASLDHPLVVILEDAQWVDLASMRYLEAAIGALAERPILVLGLARSPLDEVLRASWDALAPQELSLRPLSERASHRLVSALVAGADGAQLARAVRLAEGVPRLLVELACAAAEGAGLPETAVALAQERLAALEPDAVAVLCAASVFSHAFASEGVDAVLGGPRPSRHWLATLVERELLVDEGPEAEGPLSFKHELLREAAYEMLRPSERREAHDRALRWLRARGERDPAVLAGHGGGCA